MLVALAALITAEPVAAQSPLGLRPEGSTFRVVVIPIQAAGKRAPSAPKLRRMLDRASRWFAKASYGRMRLEGAIAPTFVAGPLTRRLHRDEREALHRDPRLGRRARCAGRRRPTDLRRPGREARAWGRTASTAAAARSMGAS